MKCIIYVKNNFVFKNDEIIYDQKNIINEKIQINAVDK